MTGQEIKARLLNFGYEYTNEYKTCLQSPNGRITIGFHKPLDGYYDKPYIKIKIYKNNFLLKRGLASDVQRLYLDDIMNISLDGNKLLFKTQGEPDVIIQESKVNENVTVKCIFEVNTINNVKNVTLTDIDLNKTFSAYYDLDLKDWNGSAREVSTIISALINYKLTIDSLENGMTEVYSDGKTKLFKD